MTTAHCSSCGTTDYESLSTGDQGYTACCNKRVCSGTSESKYGTPTRFVRACCWGTATPKFGKAGVPDGSSKL